MCEWRKIIEKFRIYINEKKKCNVVNFVRKNVWVIIFNLCFFLCYIYKRIKYNKYFYINILVREFLVVLCLMY